MCIIIYKPLGVELPSEQTLRHCWDQNDDGVGYVIPNSKGKPIIHKFMEFDPFYEAITDDLANADKDVVIHMRWATHGKVSLENVHPFRINRDLVFCHNGSLPNFHNGDKQYSDTRCFRDQILKTLGTSSNDDLKWVFGNDAVGFLLDDIIGKDKMVFMTNDGEVWIIGEDRGEWVDGIWYSNNYYKKKRWAGAACYDTQPQPRAPYSYGYDGYGGYYSSPSGTSTYDDYFYDRRENQTYIKCSLCDTSISLERINTVYVIKLGGYASITYVCGHCSSNRGVRLYDKLPIEYTDVSRWAQFCFDCGTSILGGHTDVVDHVTKKVMRCCAVCASRRLVGHTIEFDEDILDPGNNNTGDNK